VIADVIDVFRWLKCALGLSYVINYLDALLDARTIAAENIETVKRE
jgi:hypothetical protein